MDSSKIKKDLKEHLDRTAAIIRSHDGWNMVDMAELSERELLQVAAQNGLDTDQQTRTFCKFISIGTNFASLDFRQRLQNIPALVASVKDLIVKMEQEIKEFADIASFFHFLIQAFVKIVMNTKHNMRMALPHLEESIVHMRIMVDALKPESANPLSTDDLLDVDLALGNMSYGIRKLLEHASTSKTVSIELDNRINELKENIESKITVCENRISFGKLIPKIGATVGMVSGASSVGAAVESVAWGGAGALVLGGFSFPPLGAILLGASIGAFGLGTILLMIIKLWEKHQFRALAYLQEILDKLNKLSSANIAFMDYMNRSEEDANKILNNIEFFKRNVRTGSARYRVTNAAVCEKAIDSTNDIIDVINQISRIDLRQWVNDNEVPNYSLLGDEIINAINNNNNNEESNSSASNK